MSKTSQPAVHSLSPPPTLFPSSIPSACLFACTSIDSISEELSVLSNMPHRAFSEVFPAAYVCAHTPHVTLLFPCCSVVCLNCLRCSTPASALIPCGHIHGMCGLCTYYKCMLILNFYFLLSMCLLILIPFKMSGSNTLSSSLTRLPLSPFFPFFSSMYTFIHFFPSLFFLSTLQQPG